MRAGHLPKRQAQNTEGTDEDGRISAGSTPPAAPNTQRMAGYRLRAGHLPKRHAQNTEGMDEDGRISAESMPPGPAC